jgi:hypothetical protein
MLSSLVLRLLSQSLKGASPFSVVGVPNPFSLAGFEALELSGSLNSGQAIEMPGCSKENSLRRI